VETLQIIFLLHNYGVVFSNSFESHDKSTLAHSSPL